MGLFSPAAREFGDMFYEFEEAYVLDGSAFTRTFGFAPTPNDQAVRRTLAWLREQEAAGGSAPLPAAR